MATFEDITVKDIINTTGTCAKQVNKHVLTFLNSINSVSDIMQSEIFEIQNKNSLLDVMRKAEREGNPRLWCTQGLTKPLVHKKKSDVDFGHPFDAISFYLIAILVTPTGDAHFTGLKHIQEIYS